MRGAVLLLWTYFGPYFAVLRACKLRRASRTHALYASSHHAITTFSVLTGTLLHRVRAGASTMLIWHGLRLIYMVQNAHRSVPWQSRRIHMRSDCDLIAI